MCLTEIELEDIESIKKKQTKKNQTDEQKILIDKEEKTSFLQKLEKFFYYNGDIIYVP